MQFVDQPSVLNLTYISDSATCNNTADGQLTVFVDGGVPSYNYSWSTGDSTALVTGLAPDNLRGNNYRL